MNAPEKILRTASGEIHTVDIVIRDDPLKSLGDERYHFAAKTFHPVLTKGVQVVGGWGAFDGILLAVLFGDPRRQRVTGSAVMVAPGVALAAWHVFAPEMDSNVSGTAGCLLISATMKGLMIWRAAKVTQMGDSDIAIVSVACASAMPPDNVFNQAAISTRTPAIGEQVMICGYRARKEEYFESGPASRIDTNVYASTGKVTQSFPHGRDRRGLPFPCLEVSCPALGGMSGGPAFDKFGRLVGLLSTSVESPENSGPSYVSTVWPALSGKFPIVWPAEAYPSDLTILEIDPKRCFIDRRDAIRVNPAPPAGDGKAYLNPWS